MDVLFGYQTWLINFKDLTYFGPLFQSSIPSLLAGACCLLSPSSQCNSCYLSSGSGKQRFARGIFAVTGI